MGSRFLLQGIFPTQGSNPGPLPCADSVWSEPHGSCFVDVSWCVAPPGGDSGASSRWFSGGPGASQLVLVVENPPASEGDLRGVGSVPGLGRFPRGGHSNPQYAWRIPRKEEPGPLQSIGSQRVRHHSGLARMQHLAVGTLGLWETRWSLLREREGPCTLLWT